MDQYTISQLHVSGFDGEVPHDYWDAGSSTLLIMLPGLGYTNQMPIMFYLHEMAMQRSWDVLQVNYNYRGMTGHTPKEERDARFLGDCMPLIQAALAQREYTNVILAGKSIGTRVMTTLLEHGFDKAAAYIWLTPLFADPDVFTAARSVNPGIAVYGDADPAMGGVGEEQVVEAGIATIVVPGGDHSLEVASGIPDSIAALARAYQQLDAWLTDTIPN